MPLLDVTTEMSNAIKMCRKKAKIRGDILSKDLKKNTSFISYLENGRINKIDSNLLYNIFEIILPDKEERITTINKLIHDLNFSLSEEEIEKQEWMKMMDLQYRILPIPDNIVTFIESSLRQLELSPEELVSYINENKELTTSCSKEEYDELEVNKVYIRIENESKGFSETLKIKFNMPSHFIEDIINKKIIRCNYVSLLVIIKSIYEIEGNNDCYENAKQFLQDNKFYTLSEKRTFMKNKNIDMLSNYDIKSRKIIQLLINQFIAIDDTHPDFLQDKLEVLYNNIKTEPSLTFASLSKDLSGLKNLSMEQKKDFIADYSDLILKYKQYILNEIPAIEEL